MKIDSNNLILDYLYKKKDFLTSLLKKEKIKKSRPIFPNQDKIKKIKKIKTGEQPDLS